MVDGRIDEVLSPELGPARVEVAPCTHHRPRTGECSSNSGLYHCACPTACSQPRVCGYEGDCVDDVPARSDIAVNIATPRETIRVTSQAGTGRLEHALQELENGQRVNVTLDIPGQQVLTFEAALPAAFAVAQDAVGYPPSARGVNLTMTWTPANDNSVMHLHLPANHHVPYGFSTCETSESAGSVVAAASITDPLGLEGGTATRAFVGTANLDIGCVEIVIGVSGRIGPRF